MNPKRPRKKSEELEIYTDGASRGNPGPGSYAFVFKRKEGKVFLRDSGYIGHTTNNQAEYIAIIKAIEKSKEVNKTKISLYSDSKLVVNQLNQKWRVKDDKLRKLYNKALKYIEEEKVGFSHVSRENRYIKIADKLCNQVLDKKGH
ncbi:MAG: Ribonuclease HI [Candidatus Methanohalarchaeum thermophilum]|uniref:Ribonuclease HI n=1 Tax=Methanohalarchaeum thermophilum TaxID=1903181 RepID=A0A1Q6DTZ7_METT1|nr:MAG: Ribonuclease HI [Candidatus Methanohalarchaeum thermophilum]